MAREDRNLGQNNQGWCMGDPKALTHHKKWFAGQKQHSRDRAMNRNRNPQPADQPVDVSGLVGMVGHFLNRAEAKREKKQKVKITDGNKLEKNFFKKILGK